MVQWSASKPSKKKENATNMTGNRYTYSARYVVTDESRMAVEILYKEYYTLVRNVCIGILKNDAAADDCAQETFMQLLGRIDQFRGQASIKSYLHTIARNQALMWWRKKSNRELSYEGYIDDGINQETTGNCLKEIKASKHIAHCQHNGYNEVLVKESLAKMPKGYKRALLLHDMRGHEHDEVGAICGISAGTSKSQLHKARLKMRRIINDEQD